MQAAAKTPTVDLLTPEQVRTRLAADLPAWTQAGNTIHRVMRTGGWKATLMVVNTIGHLAEAAWHHPDLQVSYDRVGIGLSTHDAGGITAKDLALATRIEAVLMWRPGSEPGSVLSGTPDDPAHRYIVYD